MRQGLHRVLRAVKMISCLAAVISSPGLALGTVIYEQPPSSPPANTAFLSNAFALGPFPVFEAFDDVTLPGPATVTGVHWFGDLFPFLARQFDPATDTANFIIRFSNDNAGLPSLTPFYEETVVANGFVTGTPLVFEFSADPIPEADLPGNQRIWISIVGNDPRFGVFLWTTAIVGGPAVSHDDVFILQQPGAAFSLLGVGEPPPLPLLGFGLAWLAGVAAKRLPWKEWKPTARTSRVPRA